MTYLYLKWHTNHNWDGWWSNTLQDNLVYTQCSEGSEGTQYWNVNSTLNNVGYKTTCIVVGKLLVHAFVKSVSL